MDPIIKQILKTIEILSQDQYGNYVIQHVLEFGQPEHKSIVIEVVKKSLSTLSKQKFSRHQYIFYFTNQ
jgi:hypothetical protein